MDLEKGPPVVAGVERRDPTVVVQPNDIQPGMIRPGMSYGQRLFHYTYNTADEKMLFMEFRLLQRLNLVSIQNELARCKATVWKDMSASKEDMEKLRITLRDYATAVRDYDFLQKMGHCELQTADERRDDLTDAFDDIAAEFGAPYNTSYRFLEEVTLSKGFDPLRNGLRKYLPRFLSYSKEEKTQHVLDYHIRNKPPKQISPFVDHLARFIIAFVTGASLITPMVIMSIDKSLTKSLVTTSIAVLLLAGFVSLVIRASNSEIVVATAAYAAVLVVFVGISG